MGKRTATASVNMGPVIRTIVGESNRKSFFEGTKQAVENSDDAGARRIDFDIRPDEGIFRILDDGTGFDEKDINSFVSIFSSWKAGGKKTTGQHGTGRTFLFQFSRGLRVTSVSKEFPSGVTVDLSYERLEKIIGGEHEVEYTEGIRLPAWWHRDKGTYGSAIELIDVDWKLVPPVPKIIEDLASSINLRRALVERMFINGTPLKPREIVGEALIDTYEVEGLGEVNVELWMPKEKSKVGDDHVQIGGHNPICKLSIFAHNLDPALARLVPEILLMNSVMAGQINVPALNQFRSHFSGGEQGFKAKAYDSKEAKALVKFLAEELDLKLQEMYGRREEEDDRRAKREQVAYLVNGVNPAFGYESDADQPDKKETGTRSGKERSEGSGKSGGPTLVLSSRAVQICGGDSTELSVVGTTDNDYDWDDTGAGGTVSPKTARKVTYTAGMTPGKFVLTVKKRSDTTKRAKVAITVTTGTKLQISPGATEIIQGNTKLFKAKNHEAAYGQVKWRLSSKAGIAITNETGLATTVQVSDKCRPGTYQLFADYVDHPMDDPATATITVTVGQDLTQKMKLDTKVYVIRTATTNMPHLVSLTPNVFLSTTDDGKSDGLIELNLDHPDLTESLPKMPHGGELEPWFQNVLASMITAHLAAELRDGNVGPEELHERFESIRTTVLQSRAVRSRKK